ncbi:MAG: zf-TFIIB domain-containing protein [Planctomycetota bacterium]
MLVACGHCHHQFDVGDLKPNSQIRCHCGRQVKIPVVRARDAEIAHCSACGAPLKSAAKTCGYCKSEVALTEFNIGQICPECFARMLKGAQFCSACGVAIRPENLTEKAATPNCPRCDRESLVARVLPRGRFDECSACGGLWLPDALFESILDAREDASLGEAIAKLTKLERVAPHPGTDEVRYIKCPQCSQRMHRKNFASSSGVIVDSCRGHGFWLDAFELERIVDFVESGGMARSRKRTREQEERATEAARRARRELKGNSPVPILPTGAWPKHGDIGGLLGTAIGAILRMIGKVHK